MIFVFAKIGIFCKSIAGPLPSAVQAYIHLAKWSSSVYTTIFVGRKDKTNYLSNQTWAKCHHSRNKYVLKKTSDGGPYITDMCTNVTEKMRILKIWNSWNLKITVSFWSHLVYNNYNSIHCTYIHTMPTINI